MKIKAGRCTYEIYLSRGSWYWRFVARNGRIMADGAEGYSSLRSALRAVQRFRVLQT